MTIEKPVIMDSCTIYIDILYIVQNFDSRKCDKLGSGKSDKLGQSYIQALSCCMDENFGW